MTIIFKTKNVLPGKYRWKISYYIQKLKSSSIDLVQFEEIEIQTFWYPFLWNIWICFVKLVVLVVSIRVEKAREHLCACRMRWIAITIVITSFWHTNIVYWYIIIASILVAMSGQFFSFGSNKVVVAQQWPSFERTFAILLVVWFRIWSPRMEWLHTYSLILIFDARLNVYQF